MQTEYTFYFASSPELSVGTLSVGTATHNHNFEALFSNWRTIFFGLTHRGKIKHRFFPSQKESITDGGISGSTVELQESSKKLMLTSTELKNQNVLVFSNFFYELNETIQNFVLTITVFEVTRLGLISLLSLLVYVYVMTLQSRLKTTASKSALSALQVVIAPFFLYALGTCCLHILCNLLSGRSRYYKIGFLNRLIQHSQLVAKKEADKLVFDNKNYTLVFSIALKTTTMGLTAYSARNLFVLISNDLNTKLILQLTSVFVITVVAKSFVYNWATTSPNSPEVLGDYD